MALVDPNIALSYRAPEIKAPNMLAQYAQLTQLQNAQTQQQQLQLQLEKFRRTDAAMERIRQAAMEHGGPDNLSQIGKEMIGSGDPHLVTQGMTILQNLRDKADFEKTFPGVFGAAPAPAPSGAVIGTTPAPTPEPSGAVVGAPAPAPAVTPTPLGAAAPTNAMAPAPINAMAAGGGINLQNMSDAQLQGLVIQGSKNPYFAPFSKLAQEELKQRSTFHTVSPGAAVMRGGRVVYTAPEATPDEIRKMQQLGFPITQQGYAAFRDTQRQERMLTPEEEAQRIRIAKESRALPTPSAPVAVEDPNNPGRMIYVSREQAIQGGMTPAAQTVNLPPKEIQKREANYPIATQSIKTIETNSAEFAKQIRDLANHPGLSGITGLVYGRTPNITPEARRAQAMYDQITAKGGFQMLQALRDASKHGGALGNISNQEGQQLKAAFGALNKTQDTADVKATLLDLANQVEGASQRARETYNSTYEYRSERRGNAPAPADAVDTNNPLLR
jgi:hypothetical protein